MFVIGSVVRAGFALQLASDLLLSILLVAGVFMVVRHRILQWTAGMFVLLAIVVRWAGIVFGTPWLLFWNRVLTLLSALAFLLIVLWWVYREGSVTGHRVRGAVAAYLLLALCFSFAYDLIEYVHPGSFTLPLGGAQGIQTRSALFLYFSVVTSRRSGSVILPPSIPLRAPGDGGGPGRHALSGHPARAPRDAADQTLGARVGRWRRVTT
jgi:hypothetical protein